MIDLAQFDRETLLIAGAVLGLFLGALIGFFACALFAVRRDRSAYRAGSRDTEKLIRDRLLQDRRDSMPYIPQEPARQRF